MPDGPADAIATLSQLGTAQPGLLGEILPASAWPGDASAAGSVSAAPSQQLAATPDGLRGIALGVIRDSRITDPLVVQYLAAFVARAARPAGAGGVPGSRGPGSPWPALSVFGRCCTGC